MADGPTILIVEDDKSIARIIEITLRHFNPRCDHRDNGQDALAYLDVTRPDLIILDIAMPAMTGWQFLELMRENPAHRDIPVFVITAHNDSANRMTGQLQGVDGYMSKPIEPETLRQEVAQILGMR